MTEFRVRFEQEDGRGEIVNEKGVELTPREVVDLLNKLYEENEYLKKQLKSFKDWINSDKYDYELTLAFIKNKGYSLKDVLEYEKEMKKND